MFVVLVVITVLVLGTILIHNAIIGRFNASRRAWGDVIAQERQKNEILPALEKVAKDYAGHEQGLMEKVTALRGALAGLSGEHIDTRQLAEAEQHMGELLSRLNLTVEAYPDLKATDTYGKLMHEITEQQQNVGAAIRIFNRNVERFNTGIEVFPNSLINRLFTHKKPLDTFDDSQAAAGIEFKPKF